MAYSCQRVLDIVGGIEWLINRKSAIMIFGNVNRGILVEEEASVRENPDPENNVGELARQAIKWFLDPPSELSGSSFGEIQTIVSVDPQRPYYGQFLIPLSNYGAKSNLRIHVVFLDTLSLLEPLPGGDAGKALNFGSAPLGVENYLTFGGFSDDRGASRERTVGGKLLSDLVNNQRWEEAGCINSDGGLCAAYHKCPFAQNARWLRSLGLRRRFLDILRSAEIAATRRLTYRDLLGHLSLAILGRVNQSWLVNEHPCEWVRQTFLYVNDGAKDAIAELIIHRIYNAVFPSPEVLAWKKASVQPREKDTVYRVAIAQMLSSGDTSRNQAFEMAFNYLDPARDTDYWDNGLREKTLDAVESMEIESPSKQLLGQSVFEPDANSDIEILLDQVVQDEITAEVENSSKAEYRGNPAQRAKLLRKWRNTLLLRQVGLATGYISFREVISAWLSEQYNALNHDTLLALGKGIESLLLPHAQEGRLLLVPLRPRTYSLDRDNLPINTLMVAVDSSNLKIDLVPRGDILMAEVLRSGRGSRQRPEVIASVVIDLSIAREAILRHRCGENSFTEIGTSSFARIERVRASLVGRELLKQVSVYFTDELGKPILITSNPAGPAPLRALITEQEL